MKYRIIAFLLMLAVSAASAQTQTVGLFWNDSLAYNGYTLFAPGNHKHVYLIDNCGYEVHSWGCDTYNNHMAYLLEDGSLLRTGVLQSYHFQAGGRCGIVDCYSWDGDLLWEFEYHAENYHQHHDIEPMPNGNFLMIVWYKYTEQHAIAQGKNPQQLQGELWMDRIMEVEPSTGNIVWEWNSWDHLIQDHDASKANYGVVADHPERIDINYTDDPGPGSGKDWMHTNSVAYNAELDQVMVSVRNYSEIWIIDHSTTTEEAAGSTGGIYGKGGDLLYRWGNPEAYGRGGSDDQILRFMHDSYWIPEGYTGENNIIVFNNQHSNQQSAVIEFDPPEYAPGVYADPGDDPYGPETYEWIYDGGELFSSNTSGSERLPNGNTLICLGQGGIFTEVTYENKEIVWRYRSPVNMFGRISQGSSPTDISQFKIRRYGPDYDGFEGKELIPGNPVELNPWPYDCTIYEDTTLLTIDHNFEMSEVVVINPFTDNLIIKTDDFPDAGIQVYNMQGVLMTQMELNAGRETISTRSWPAGIYILKVIKSGWHVQSIKVLKPN